MCYSIKQLLRTPIKAAMFFLLIIGSSLLITVGSILMIWSLERINTVEEQFTTIGTIEQLPNNVDIATVTWNNTVGIDYSYSINEYSSVIPVDILNIEDANYILSAENRPYYFVSLPNFRSTNQSESSSYYIFEFCPFEDCTPSEPVEVIVTDILLCQETSSDVERRNRLGIKPTLEIGDVILLYDYSKEKPNALECGKTYICAASWNVWARQQTTSAYIVMPPPYSTQYCDSKSSYLSTDEARFGYISVPIESVAIDNPEYNPQCSFIEEVTSAFYEEGNRGRAWLEWKDLHEIYNSWFLVCPTSSLELLPAFHNKEILTTDGRAISEYEFSEGKPVCMISEGFARLNGLKIGDKVNLQMSFSVYGWLPDRGRMYMPLSPPYPTYYMGYTPLNADMKPYTPFWEEEYEIVGLYEPINKNALLCGSTEIATDMFIIPTKSVHGSDKNNIAHYEPMNGLTTSFQIPNGTIEEFDTVISESMPNIYQQLNIAYDDNGYSEIMGSLRNTRLTAFLLFLVGVMSAVAVVILLLLFFIVNQKRRIAIEQSLGMSKNQSRVSLITGILILTIIASIVGSVIGVTVMNSRDMNVDIVETTEFCTSYSLWVQNQPIEIEIEDNRVETSIIICMAVPLFFILCVFVFSLIFIDRNLKLDPILLLSSRLE